MKTDEEKLKWANASVWESQWGHREWRSESWRDCEIYDGGVDAWETEDYYNAIDAGIDPITVNRVFPAINKLVGSQVFNRFDIVAKGRTHKDGTISEVMTEGIKYVMDQYGGEFLISHAHQDALIPGFGCIAPCFNEDPRKERVCLRYRDWREMWWDPFSPPWWDPKRCRYVYWQPWVDIDDFKALFGPKAKEIEDAYNEYSGTMREQGYTALWDEAQQREEKIRTLSSADWVDAERKRIRPVEFWYTVNEDCLFAISKDGRCTEVRDGMDPRQAFELIKSSQNILKANVKKMRTMTFFGEHLLLQDIPTPYPHDEFPFIPFVGYLDRWGFPYGVPRQVRGEVEEINKRRSMAIAMLKKRRIAIEEDAVSPSGNKEALDAIWEEANKIDGMMVLKSGGLNKLKLDEMAQLAPSQIDLLRQAEFEMRDITGSDAPQYQSEQRQSGKAKQVDQYKSSMTTASLLDNLRRSMRLLGEQVQANIQNTWTGEKVIRITDQLTKAERFVEINKPMGGGVVKNNITQGRFDVIISESPITDTIREKNLETLLEAVKRVPEKAIPTVLIAAFELSDLPNKDTLIEKLKPIMGMSPGDEDKDPQEIKEQTIKALEAQKKKADLQEKLMLEKIQAEILEQKLKNKKLAAEIEKIIAVAKETRVETEIAIEEHEAAMGREMAAGIEKGIDIKLKEAALNDTTGRGGIRKESGEGVQKPAGGPDRKKLSGVGNETSQQ